MSHGATRLAWRPTAALFWRLLADRRRSFVWWTLGMVGSALLIVAFWPSVNGNTAYDEALEDLPESMRALAGVSAELTLSEPAGYLNSQWIATLFPIVLLVFGIGAGAAAIAGAEAEGSLEDLLDGPVTRREASIGRLKAVWALVVLLGMVGLLAVLVPAPFVGLLDGLPVSDLVAASVAMVVLALLHTSLAFALGAATGERGVALGGASAVAVLGYLLYGIGQGAENLRILSDVSPWGWALDPPPIIDGFTLMSIVPSLLLALVLPVVGIWSFERRDLH